MSRDRTVGVLGLGSMGMGVALTLVEHQFTVRGFDVRQEAMDALVEAGAAGGSSPREVVEGCGTVIVLVVNAKQVDEVLFGEYGAVAGMAKGTVILQSSTVPADFARTCAARLAEHGMVMLDAPVSGGAAGARSGNLSVMASGPAAGFEISAGVLEAIAGTVHRLGDEVGVGSTVKTVNQLLAGVHIAAAAEAMAFGVRAGADPKALYDVIRGSAGSSWMFQNRVPHILEDDYTPLSAVDIFVKDLGIVLEMGHAMTFPLPLTATAHQQFLAASAAGFGREDDIAVFKVYQKLSGITIGEDDR
ncbi:MAG: NAD(P)-binding domain-containing protein [Alphaproteobacteria bacterium]|nr:NAD(P)-binding domain-containing protein [Alphaproteobacteria bacterium]